MEATATHDTSSSGETRAGDPRVQRVSPGALRAERRRERQRLEMLTARVSALRAIQRGRAARSR
jgi:hypothetical protein